MGTVGELGVDESRLRITSLDGLRGAAAFLVLVHHSLLLVPALVQPYREPGVAVEVGSAGWWFTYTPIHSVWDGGSAVMVFFVLSGFVLVTPIVRGRGVKWRSFYPARLIRLYLPVWAAIVLALIIIALAPHVTDGVSSWVAGHEGTFSVVELAKDFTLADPGFTNSALWSLRWEVLFSLLLPLYVIFALWWKRGLWVKLALLGVLLLAGAATGPANNAYQLGFLFQLPIFAVGVLFAFHWTELRPAVERLQGRALAVTWVLAIVAFSSYWLVYAFGTFDGQGMVVVAARALQVAGAAALVVLSAKTGVWSAFLNTHTLQWLGTRSFALYLVHEPIVATAGKLAAVWGLPIWLAILAAIAVALIVAEIFFRLIERPSHRFSKFVAARLSRSGNTSVAGTRRL
jgi:peptidoglycan/LPS O-acetylase OafA/YrhL